MQDRLQEVLRGTSPHLLPFVFGLELKVLGLGFRSSTAPSTKAEDQILPEIVREAELQLVHTSGITACPTSSDGTHPWCLKTF